MMTVISMLNQVSSGLLKQSHKSNYRTFQSCENDFVLFDSWNSRNRMVLRQPNDFRFMSHISSEN